MYFFSNFFKSLWKISSFISSNKLLLRKTGDSIIATFDDSGIYPEQSLYFTYHLSDSIRYLYLLTLFNSKLYTWYYRNELITNIDSTPQLKQFDLDSFPIIKAADEIQIELERFALEMISTVKNTNTQKYQELEEIINKVIYKIFQLNDEEIGLIQNEI